MILNIPGKVPRIHVAELQNRGASVPGPESPRVNPTWLMVIVMFGQNERTRYESFTQMYSVKTVKYISPALAMETHIPLITKIS